MQNALQFTSGKAAVFLGNAGICLSSLLSLGRVVYRREAVAVHYRHPELMAILGHSQGDGAERDDGQWIRQASSFFLLLSGLSEAYGTVRPGRRMG
jgi:hypothetical protein